MDSRSCKRFLSLIGIYSTELTYHKILFRVAEAQASALVRRYPSMRIASLRIHWSTDHYSRPASRPEANGAKDLFGWVQEDSAAEAFLLAIDPNNTRWDGHEAFFIVSPGIATAEGVESRTLRDKYFPEVPIREGKLIGREAFFDCSKAERLLDWQHPANG
jgi:hypothetical protein